MPLKSAKRSVCEVCRLVAFRLACCLPQQVVNQHLGMDLLLDVERRRMDHQIGPVLLVLAAPDELRVEVAVAALVGHADRALLLLLHHRLEFGRGNVLALGLVVLERLDGLAAAFGFLAMDFLYSSGCGGDSVDHLVEFGFDLGLEVGLDLIDLGEFGEGPAAILAMVVHARHPVGLHRGFLLLGVFAPIAFDLDNQVQQVIFAVPVVHQHDEVGEVLARLEP